MLLQVHDELVFTVDPKELDQLLPILIKYMQSAADLSVQLIAEAKIGENWGEMTEVKS